MLIVGTQQGIELRKVIATGDTDIGRQTPGALRRLAVLLGILLLSGCSLLSQVPDTPDPAVTNKPIPATEPPIEHPVETEPTPDRVLILLGNDASAYVEIAEAITQRGARHSYLTLNLNRNGALNADLAEQVETFNPDRIVAVGLNAAVAARNYEETPMVFCQVFNFEDHALLTQTSNGVKLLPPFSLQFEIWKKLSPELEAAGIITGPGQEPLVTEIKAAAAEHGIELLSRTVKTDRETLFAYKRLTPKIGGFLLLPDNRVLSPRVLRDIVSYSKKHGTQIVVFNPQLLQLGADISFTSRSVDVADTVLRVINSFSDHQPERPSRMTALTTLRADISPEIAKNLSSETTGTLAPYLDAAE